MDGGDGLGLRHGRSGGSVFFAQHDVGPLEAVMKRRQAEEHIERRRKALKAYWSRYRDRLKAVALENTPRCYAEAGG